MAGSESQRPRPAGPLLLIPVGIERKSTPKGTRFEITMGQGGIKENAALRLKLEQDFGMALPEFQTEDEAEPGTGTITTPEAYFDAVTTMAAQRKGWRVRRFGTFAPFTFGNIAIFHDLAPENWPGDAALE